jgi:hypothetical protein
VGWRLIVGVNIVGKMWGGRLQGKRVFLNTHDLVYLNKSGIDIHIVGVLDASPEGQVR